MDMHLSICIEATYFVASSITLEKDIWYYV